MKYRVTPGPVSPSLSLALALVTLAVAALGCATPIRPDPFAALNESIKGVRDGANASLDTLYAQSRERFIRDAAAPSADRINALLLESVPEDPFGWRPGGSMLFLQTGRFRDAVFFFNSALMQYTELLLRLASQSVLAGEDFDEQAKVLNANVRSAAAALGVGRRDREIAIFSTLAVAAAREYLASRQHAALKRAITGNQKTIVDAAQLGADAMHIAVRAVRNEYDLASAALARQAADQRLSEGERVRRVQELMDLDTRFIAELAVLRSLHDSYTALPAAHAELAAALDREILTLAAIGRLHDNGQRLFRLAEQLERAETRSPK